MPLVKVSTSEALGAEERTALCARLSKIAAEVIGKPEQYVQVVVAAGPAAICFAGRAGTSAFVEVRSIGGLSAKVNGRLSEQICAALAGVRIPAERVYLNFLDVPASHWGHDGSTFG